jgi:glutathione peroxidase-family protein
VNGENAGLVYKFLVDRDGQIVDRYYPTTSPLSLEVKASFAVLC